jgi:hypothetical protein
VPKEGDPSKGWTTHLYGAAAVFSLRYSDEATVMKANQPYVSPYRLSYREEPSDPAEVVVERESEDDPEMPF